jgi:hypothetical protein
VRVGQSTVLLLDHRIAGLLHKRTAQFYRNAPADFGIDIYPNSTAGHALHKDSANELQFRRAVPRRVEYAVLLRI